MAHHKQVPNRFGKIRDEWQLEVGQTLQCLKIVARNNPTAFVPFVECFEFYAEHGGLQFVQTRIETFARMLIFHLEP